MENGTADSRDVELLEKNKPQQQRAIRTYEAILKASGELLCEVGLERISTNNIAERAGVTVPALYRYFPNKYAVLNALGARLMDVQNAVFVQWHQKYVENQPAQVMLDSLYQLLYETYLATREFEGGLAIMHGMQAMAPLQEVRLDSHWAVAEGFGRIWSEQFGVPCTAMTIRRARLAVELGFMSVQMALEDSRLDADQTLSDGADALRVYLEFTAREAGVSSSQS